MKKVAIILVPLILFIGFLAFKPPVVVADNQPVSAQTTQEVIPSKPAPGNSKEIFPKPLVGEDNNEEHPEKPHRKPQYGGHDEDDYDNDEDD